MGCGGSKVDDLPLVTLCRERKEYIKAAADHRYALASAHLSYFRSLKDVGEALCRFVEEELVIGSSPTSSPVLTLPSDEGKKKPKQRDNNKVSSSSTSLSHSLSFSHRHESDSHIHLDSESGSDSDLESESFKLHSRSNPEGPQPEASSSSPPIDSRGNPYPYSAYYMKKSSTAIPSVVYEGAIPSVVYEGPRMSQGVVLVLGLCLWGPGSGNETRDHIQDPGFHNFFHVDVFTTSIHTATAGSSLYNEKG